MDNWSVVYVATLPQDIYPAKNLLESEGITTFTRDELTAQVNNFYSNAIGGVRLLVHNSELERAREILVEGGYIRPEDYQAPSEAEVIHTADRAHCPYCGSAHISKTKEANAAAVLLAYMIGLVLPIFKRTYQCWDCNKNWKFGRKRQKA